MKKKTFFFLIIIISLLIVELFAGIFFFLNNEKIKFTNYQAKANSNSNYFFSKDINLVFPKPDTVVTHFTSEFVDRFYTKNILKNFPELGFFDNGIDENKKNIFAIGDSFTRGVGSENNLKYSWVPLVENQLKNYNLINLGNLGPGINQQFSSYKKIRNILNHKLVLYNFFSGNDYFDNLSDVDFNLYLSKLANSVSLKELNNIVYEIQSFHGFNYHMYYWSNFSYKSYGIYFFLKIYDYLLNKRLAPEFLINKKNNIFQRLNIKINQARSFVVSDEIFNIKKIEINNAKICNKNYCFNHNEEFTSNRYIQSKMVSNSVNKINEFYNFTKKNNIDFVLIVHPSARNLDKKFSDKYEEIDKLLLSGLNKNIPVLKLSKDINQFIQKNKNIKFFHKYDGHYTKQGYLEVSNIIYKYLNDLGYK